MTRLATGQRWRLVQMDVPLVLQVRYVYSQYLLHSPFKINQG